MLIFVIVHLLWYVVCLCKVHGLIVLSIHAHAQASRDPDGPVDSAKAAQDAKVCFSVA